VDPLTIGLVASGVVKLLSAFFKTAGDRAGEDAADTAVGAAVAGTRRLLDRIRGHFADDPDASKRLEELESRPDDPEVTDGVRTALERHLASDDSFAQDVAAGLQQVSQTEADVAFVNNIQGDVQKLVQIQTVHGDVNI
jgi:hypothetical protein